MAVLVLVLSTLALVVVVMRVVVRVSFPL